MRWPASMAAVDVKMLKKRTGFGSCCTTDITRDSLQTRCHHRFQMWQWRRQPVLRHARPHLGHNGHGVFFKVRLVPRRRGTTRVAGRPVLTCQASPQPRSWVWLLKNRANRSTPVRGCHHFLAEIPAKSLPFRSQVLGTWPGGEARDRRLWCFASCQLIIFPAGHAQAYMSLEDRSRKRSGLSTSSSWPWGAPAGKDWSPLESTGVANHLGA